MTQKEAAKRMAAAGQAVAEKRLTWGTSGNMSIRLDAEHVLITGSGTRLDALREDDFSLIRIGVDGYTGRKPSKEASAHMAVYRVCPWAEAVLHASPPAATMFSITGTPVRNDLFVENMYYLARVATVGYNHPGCDALTHAIGQAALTHNVMLMAHHGALVYDTSIEEALTGLEVLEATCRMQKEAAQAGHTLPGLPPAVVHDFLMNARYKPKRPWLS